MLQVYFSSGEKDRMKMLKINQFILFGYICFLSCPFFSLPTAMKTKHLFLPQGCFYIVGLMMLVCK